MEWLNELSGTTVALDTAPLIYFIERNPRYLPLVLPFFEAVERGEVEVVTSTLTLTEVLIHPYRYGNRALAQRYSDILLHSTGVRTLAVSAGIADRAAEIRARHGLKTPDSIQLATALSAKATSFLTNDGELAAIPGLRVIELDRLLASPRH